MSNTLDTAALLADADAHRLVLQATLVPVTGDLFQPAGFPDIGHVIYSSPRIGPDGKPEKICIVDSAASMANHLEAVSLASTQTLELHPDLTGMPYVECVTGEIGKDSKLAEPRLVVTSLSEGHRLASSYFLDEKGKAMEGDKVSERNFGTVLRDELGIQDLGKKTHPLPGDWWNVFRTIFRYDPNSLVHGILFPAMGIKLSRVLTAHHEAFGADRVGLSGVKFDKLGKTTSGQPIFSVDKETAREIRATFVIDLSLLRSFGREVTKAEAGAKKQSLGLSDEQKRFLLELALWKIGRLLSKPYRFRSGCDLKLAALVRIEEGQPTELPATELSRNISAAIASAGFQDPRITKVYWPAGELFKKPSKDEAAEGEEDGTTDSDEE